MGDYLTPAIGKAIPLLSQTCEDLIRQDLIRCLTQKTQEWCEGDPELAETILDGTKTLSGCVKYVLEQAASVIAKKVEAMPEKEFKALPIQDIGGRKIPITGGAISDEKVYEWAHDYYYKAEEKKENASATIKNDSGKTIGNKKDSTNKSRKKSTTTSTSAASAKDDSTKAEPKATDNRPPEQMTLIGAVDKTAA